MKTWRYAAVVLAIVIVALFIQHRAKPPENSTSIESPNFKRKQEREPQPVQLETISQIVASNPTYTVKLPVVTNRIVPRQLGSPSSTVATIPQQPSIPFPASQPIAGGARVSVGPPLTPVSPAPSELHRTNSVEVPPGAGRRFSGP